MGISDGAFPNALDRFGLDWTLVCATKVLSLELRIIVTVKLQYAARYPARDLIQLAYSAENSDGFGKLRKSSIIFLQL
jgi:hypothetical protein